MKRHADDVTVAELVRLRVENEKLERKNKKLRTALVDIYWATEDRVINRIAFVGLDEAESWTSEQD